jgi:hypothetical protein
MAPDIPVTARPTWSPDGRHLLVFGAATINDSASTECWLVSPEGGVSTKTGLVSLLRERQVPLPSEAVDWIGDALFFGSGSSIWTIGFRDGSLQPETLRKLASSTTEMVGVRGSASKVVFESRTEASHLWSVPLDSN